MSKLRWSKGRGNRGVGEKNFRVEGSDWEVEKRGGGKTRSKMRRWGN